MSRILAPAGPFQSPASAKPIPQLGCLGHRFVAKTAEALGISGEDNRYKEYNWADEPQARWGGRFTEYNDMLPAAALHF